MANSHEDMAQRFIINKAAILAAAVEPGPYIYSVQMDRIPASITDECRGAQSNVLVRSPRSGIYRLSIALSKASSYVGLAALMVPRLAFR